MGCQAFARVPEDRVPNDRTYRRRSGAKRSYECPKIRCQTFVRMPEDQMPDVRTSARRSYGCQTIIRMPGDLTDESSKVSTPRKNLVVDLQNLASGVLPAELTDAGEAALRKKDGKPGGDEKPIKKTAE